MSMKLQLAMDMTDWDLYWDVLEQCHEYADFIEIGIMGTVGGARLISLTHEKYPDAVIVYDSKSDLAFRTVRTVPFGPDYYSVSASANDKNLDEIVDCCHKAGVKVIGDAVTIRGCNGPEDMLRLLRRPIDQISLHPDADSRKYPVGDTFMLQIAKALAPADMEISVYGGFTKENVAPVLELKPDIVVVGKDIWNADDPKASIIAWKELLAEYDAK